MDFNALADFHLVATHGGLGKASRASGRSKATLSRRIADLEEALGVRLVERGSQGLELTEAGQLLCTRTEGPLRELDEALIAAREGQALPRGLLRVAAPLLFSQLVLGRLAAKFRKAYPEIQIEVVSEDRFSHLIDEHFDVAIRINPQPDTALVGRCFAKDELVMAAAPTLQRPEGPANAPVAAPAVVMATYRDGDIWSVREGQLCIDPQPVLRMTSLLTVKDAAVAGAGVAMLPRSIIASELAAGQLISWGTAGGKIELWVLHTSRRLKSPKVRAFVDFISSQYADGQFCVPDAF